MNSRCFLLLAATLVCFVMHLLTTEAMGQHAGKFPETKGITPVEGAGTAHKIDAVSPVIRPIIQRTSVQPLDAPRRSNMTRSLDRTASFLLPPQGPPKQNWIKRHPVLFGSLVGFGGGFLVGAAGGDDGIFYDFTATGNGLILGGFGAGGGAVIGLLISR